MATNRTTKNSREIQPYIDPLKGAIKNTKALLDIKVKFEAVGMPHNMDEALREQIQLMRVCVDEIEKAVFEEQAKREEIPPNAL